MLKPTKTKRPRIIKGIVEATTNPTRLQLLKVCKANNNVREGRSLKKVLCDCNQTKNKESYIIRKQENRRRQGNRFRKQNRKQKQFRRQTQSHGNTKQCSENRKQEN